MTALAKMLYIVNDEEGRDIVSGLTHGGVEFILFYCTDEERRLYRCPRLLTTEGEWQGRTGIEQYLREVPLLATLRRGKQLK